MTPLRRAAATTAAPAVGCSARRSASSSTAPARPGAPYVCDARELEERCEQVAQDGLECCGANDQLLALENVDVHEAGDTRRRVPGVRAAVEERRGTLVPERGAHPVADDDGTERHVPRADPLRAGHQIGREAVPLAAEPAAEPPEAGDHLVRDQEDAPFATDSLDCRPVAVRRRDRAAGTDQRLADERRRGSPSASSVSGEVVRVVVRDLRDASDERSEAVAHRGDARQRGAIGVRAVVGCRRETITVRSGCPTSAQ